ncbi:MAG: electron transport complex subunit RsxG [Reinekea sp.]|nr:electron transport complex subunit RsxG [Reinekea sp.]
MTDNPENSLTLPAAIRKSAIGLAIFALFTAGIISVTQVLTKETIADNEKAFEARLLLSLLPEGFEAETLLNSARPFQSVTLAEFERLHVGQQETFYTAKNNEGEIAAILLPVVAPEGYTEAIRLIVGISPSGELVGVRVTKHKETPGLGDQVDIAKSDWIHQFDGKSRQQPAPEQWFVKKDGGAFDQLTGATITPRAIVKAIDNSLRFFEMNKEVLLGNASHQEGY